MTLVVEELWTVWTAFPLTLCVIILIFTLSVSVDVELCLFILFALAHVCDGLHHQQFGSGSRPTCWKCTVPAHVEEQVVRKRAEALVTGVSKLRDVGENVAAEVARDVLKANGVPSAFGARSNLLSLVWRWLQKQKSRRTCRAKFENSSPVRPHGLGAPGPSLDDPALEVAFHCGFEASLVKFCEALHNAFGSAADLPPTSRLRQREATGAPFDLPSRALFLADIPIFGSDSVPPWRRTSNAP